MRIIAGSAKGHTLKSLKGMKTRPTLDRVREAVFNVLSPGIVGSKFLDLFAGTGAVGIEALSRGAEICFFNEKDKKACSVIRENLRHCRLETQARVFNMDVRDFLAAIPCEFGLLFDIVYLDPPYHSQLYEECFAGLNRGVLARNALVIAETDANSELQEEYQKLCLVKRSRYGDTSIWYYKYNNE